MSRRPVSHDDSLAADGRRLVPSQVASSPGAPAENPAWGLQAVSVQRWPAAVAVLVAVVLYATLPGDLAFRFGPRWLQQAVVGLELALLLPVAVTDVSSRWRGSSWDRPISMTLIAVVGAGNAFSLGYLVDRLVHGSIKAAGTQILVAAAMIWLTNILVFALWYWELDRGGPIARCSATHRHPDFLFPQMSTPQSTQKRWTPSFVDYLYVAFTNATAFSPTDTMPLTAWAKTLMAIQSAASLLTVALVAARAVNVLS